MTLLAVLVCECGLYALWDENELQVYFMFSIPVACPTSRCVCVLVKSEGAINGMGRGVVVPWGMGVAAPEEWAPRLVSDVVSWDKQSLVNMEDVLREQTVMSG